MTAQGLISRGLGDEDILSRLYGSTGRAIGGHDVMGHLSRWWRGMLVPTDRL